MISQPLDTHDLPPLSHGVMQVIARRVGVDLLHVKGPAVDVRLLKQQADGRPIDRPSSDADVLVRPGHEQTLIDAAGRHGWTVRTGFDDGSPFGHATTLWHDQLGYCDLHRAFPGVDADPAVAFERWWSERTVMPIGHIECAVPSVTAQRLVLLLHAARSHHRHDDDVERCWTNATDDERAATDALARDLDAEVALASVTDRLSLHRTDRRHDLWAYFSGPGPESRITEWRVRLRAEPSWRRRAQVLAHALRVNRGHLEMDLGHRASPRERVAHQGARVMRLASEVRAALVRRLRPDKDEQR